MDDGFRSVFVARQPILDREQRLVHYELLFRSSAEDVGSDARDGDAASSHVISNSLLALGFQALTQGRPAFVNLTRKLLVEGTATVLPPDKYVLEILETVEPDDEVLAACRRLVASGYRLALDDFVWRPGVEPLLDMVDFVKVDFLATDEEERRALVRRLAGRRARLLAEKLETRESFEEAMGLGYAYFQGYYFCRPQIVTGCNALTHKLSYLRLLQEIYRERLNLDALAEIIRHDVSLAVKLLRMVNSWVCGLAIKREITSIKHALVLLGEDQVRKWVSLIGIGGLCRNQPSELFRTCLSRARMAELVGPGAGLKDRRDDLFFTGILSAIDAILGCTLDEALEQLAPPRAVLDALLGGSTPLAKVLSLVLSYERGDWAAASRFSQELGVDEAGLPALYYDALDWSLTVGSPD